MRLVVLESPFAGNTDKYTGYARQCLTDCLERGDAPIASHLLFTQPGALDDDKPEERAKGIASGHAWISRADAVVAYTDYGLSSGMMQGVKEAERLSIPVEYRQLPFVSVAA